MEFDPAFYGETVAHVYDDMPGIGDPGDTLACVNCLKDLAGKGSVLELGIGTGRIALPLRRAHVNVHGLDSSSAMVAVLRSKDGGGEIPLLEGTFTHFTAPQPYDLIYLVFDSLALLTEQADQVATFKAAAAALRDGGHFVVQTYLPAIFHGKPVPPVFILDGGAEESTVLQFTKHDPVKQRLHASFNCFGNEKLRRYPMNLRYVWPSELNLMAELAGLKLESRVGGWSGEPFTEQSTQVVSIFVKIAREGR